MSHFILLRQRIKVIETIKKTTGAMRLIAMSLHSRLRNQKSALEHYSAEIQQIATRALPAEPLSAENVAIPATNKLIILIGSQKGLCGTFNENLFQFFSKQVHLTGNEHIATVGKHATDYIKKLGVHPYRSYDQFGPSNFVTVATALKKLCLEQAREVIVVSNNAPTFFSQKPRMITLAAPRLYQDAFLNYLSSLQLKARCLHILHESLLAEQAARFVAMDMAYRNAQDILNQTKLDYNKTRQAYVTRELIELSGGMISQE